MTPINFNFMLNNVKGLKLTKNPRKLSKNGKMN